ncbi:MAG: GDP-L-fucose synthase [Deltaproteobacteria bacterium]|nr:GDP-L-fucose synthase [Deltaproteobacteria bacterium]
MNQTGHKIYIAGHRGMVGSAIKRSIEANGCKNIISRSHEELDLTRQQDVEDFFEKERPEYVFLCAAKVGGILANSTYKAQFIYENIMIAANVIHASRAYGVKKLLNLGSSCIYPRSAPQPLKEEYLLTSELEPTNEPYAIAKIAAIKLCRYYNEQYGTNFMSVMPTNLYGLEDNFDLETSHVLPALIRRFHLAGLLFREDYGAIARDLERLGNNLPADSPDDPELITKHLAGFGIHPDKVTLWGTGAPRREFLYADDLAAAAVLLMENYDAKNTGEFINIGAGKDIAIKELAKMISEIVGYGGSIGWDNTKPDGTPENLLDISRIQNKGWIAKTSLEKGIEKTYKWYINNVSPL